MAANTIKQPLALAAKRGFAAQASAQMKVDSPPAPEVNCVMMPNKLMVSSLDVNGPLSRVSVVFRSGPRNETAKNLGVTHVIRSMTGFSTSCYTSFAVVRNLQQKGIHLTCTGDRETTGFHVVTARNQLHTALKFLSSVASSPAFKPWQVSDNLPRIKYELGCLTPQARLMDILHKAAYRDGLGNSLFIKKDHIGMHTPQMLHSFFKESFTANRGAVSGYNVTQKELLEFSNSLELSCDEAKEGNGKYLGGEIRKDKKSYFSHVAVATEGVGMKDVKEALTFALLKYVYGAQPKVLWGGSPSPMYKAVYSVAPDAGVSCFSINYSDSGLFGFVVMSPGTKAGQVVEAAFKVLKSGKVSDTDVGRAKAMLKVDILSACENSENLTEDMAIQSLFSGVVIPGPILAEAVDKISVSEVNAAARKIANGTFSLAGFGNLYDVPYLDQLC